jgi:glycerol-3-phosphate acyltransferase PlsY
MIWLLSYTWPTLFGYLIGAIPFGYLVARWLRGIDIRTVGSGNIGATNVGRVLGFRYFVLILILDALKGFGPTLGIPFLLRRTQISAPGDLAVFIALAAVLGHNFPVYLGFKGGKGVATSLGALLALDPFSCGAAAIGFFAVLLVTRYVSLSSIAGGLAFVACHFVLVSNPWSPEDRAMSMLSIAVPALLIARHHKNFRRVIAGTEPKVSLRRGSTTHSTTARSSGRINPAILFGLVFLITPLAGASMWVIRRAATPIDAVAGPWALREIHRELTGQQRSTRVVFANRGENLAVMCPRYNKVLVYRVSPVAALESRIEIGVDGRPVAIAELGDRLVVLQRPSGDDKHLQPGWWETFALDGRKVGLRVPAGYYPDDLAVPPDGRYVLVLNSGQAEGDKKKPLPCLEIFTTTLTGEVPAPVGHLNLEPTDDPDRLAISASGTRALVTLPKSKQTLAIDLADPAAPRLAGRCALPEADGPYVSSSPDGDWIVMPTAQETDAVALPASNFPHDQKTVSPALGYLIYSRPDQSDLALVQVSPRRTIGHFPLKGPFNLGGTRPSGLAFNPQRALLAVATKPGTVHLIQVSSRLGME